jgi:hypothetical protein
VDAAGIVLVGGILAGDGWDGSHDLAALDVSTAGMCGGQETVWSQEWSLVSPCICF